MCCFVLCCFYVASDFSNRIDSITRIRSAAATIKQNTKNASSKRNKEISFFFKRERRKHTHTHKDAIWLVLLLFVYIFLSSRVKHKRARVRTLTYKEQYIFFISLILVPFYGDIRPRNGRFNPNNFN